MLLADGLVRGDRVAVMLLNLLSLPAMTFITCLTTMLALGGSCLFIPDPRDLRGFLRTLRRERFSLFVGVNLAAARFAPPASAE